MQFFALNSGLEGNGGSLESTSNPAPAITSLLSASARSFSLTSPPRLTLIKNDVGFIMASSPRLTNRSFESLSGQCNDKTSAWLNNVSISVKATPSILSRSGCLCTASTCIPKPRAIRATALPIFPNPTMPNVFPCNSVIGFFQ